MLQVVEDVEEGILRSLESRKILDIIYNQDIYRLIEIEEIRDFVILRGILILEFEGIGGNIEYTCFGVLHFNLITDSVCQMGFPYSASSIDEERVEGRVSGLARNRHSGSTRQFVRLSRNKRIKRIEGVELGLEVVPLTRHIINNRFRLRLRSRGRQLCSSAGSRVNEYAVLQMRTLTENTDDGRGENLEVVFLNILRHELRFYLQHQCSVLELQRHNRREPNAVCAVGQVICQNGQTLSPLLLQFFRHYSFVFPAIKAKKINAFFKNECKGTTFF